MSFLQPFRLWNILLWKLLKSITMAGSWFNLIFVDLTMKPLFNEENES
jgi:hypothetical protein